MPNQINVLLIEDDVDTAQAYIEDAEEYFPYKIIHKIPPKELFSLAGLVKEHDAKAVVIDERLQQHSDASYLGIDALKYLSATFADLPVIILTEYDRDKDLQDVANRQLVRKSDLRTVDGKKYHFNNLSKMIDEYQQKTTKIDIQKENVASITPNEVTEENVKRIARLHFSLDEEVEQIIWFSNNEKNRVCLIEVSRTALPTDSVEPFLISASEEIPLDLLVADVTSKEWEKINKGEIDLPVNWDLKKIKVFSRDETVKGE